MRAVTLLPALALLLASGAGAQTSLPELLAEAKEKNPAVRAARERWRTAGAQASAAWSWRDPLVGIARKDMPGRDERSTMLSIEQEIPFPGKTTTEARMRTHEARIAEQEYRAKELDVLARVKIGYHLLLWLEKGAAALRRDAQTLKAASRVAQAKVAGGAAGAEDALILEARLKGIESQAFEWEQRRLEEEEEINSLLAAAPGTRRTLAPAPPPVPLGWSVEELVEKARTLNPTVLSSLHMQRHARLAGVRGALGFMPDFRLEYERESFRRERAETKYGIGVTVPLWAWKQAGELRAARAHRAQAEAETEAARLDAYKTIYKEHVELELRRRLAETYAREVVPLAESALKIALKNYETGRADYAKLAEAVRTLIEAQMKLYEEEYLFGEHWALLEQAVGGELEAKP